MKTQREMFLLVFCISMLGALFCGAQILLNFDSKSFCTSEACQIVENFSLISQSAMSAIAIVYFILQGGMALALSREKKIFKFPLMLISGTALGVESVLVGRQFIDYHLHCFFCLTVAIFVFLSAGIALLTLKRIAVFGTILGTILALLVTPLSLEPLSHAANCDIHQGDSSEQWILVYSPKCQHCREVLSFCKTFKNVDLKLCPKKKALSFLRLLGIEGVPVLIVDHRNEKNILVGSQTIISYLEGNRKTNMFFDFLPKSTSGICKEEGCD